MPLVPDSLYDTLGNIRTKVRRLTRTPSENQLSTQDIDQYVNNFVLYDFPSHLRMMSLRTVFTFYTSPYIDVYETNTTVPTDPFYNFNNKYISVHPPFYSAGYLGYYSQSREQFFGIYPKLNSIQQIGIGDNATTNFTGFIPGLPSQSDFVCLLRGAVIFDSIDLNGNGLTLVDQSVPNSIIGNLIVPNDTTTIMGTINYVTGQYVVNFPAPPGQGQIVNSQVVITQASIPRALLFYDNKITVRPVPDQPYQLSLEAYTRPTQLLTGTQDTQIAQWWQYIAYGAAKKVFEDRMDIDSVAMILPEYKKQELLVLRTTILELANERTASIYTEQTNFGSGSYGEWGGGLFIFLSFFLSSIII